MVNEFVKNILVKEICEITYTMWNLGWDEKNGGNISVILEDNLVDGFSVLDKELIKLKNIPQNLLGKSILITASGSSFKSIKEHPEKDLGVITIESDGYRIIWGFKNDSEPTSEIYMHLLSHSARLEQDSTHRVVIHNHATDVLKMTFVHELDDYRFTRSLWGMITECVVVFPDGVSVLPWMLCGNEAIGLRTAEKLEKSRIVVWAYHGILATGSSIKDAFGLIETVNKAAKIYCETLEHRINPGITDNDLVKVCQYFGIIPREDFLKLSHS